MKKLILMTCAAGLALALTGCVTYYRDSGADYLKRPGTVLRSQYYTEYQVSQKKVNGFGEASVWFWLIHLSDGKFCQVGAEPNLTFLSLIARVISPTQRAVSNAKGSALFQACEKSSADQILGVTFEYRITDYFFFARVECTATGFPATAISVKPVESQPIILNQWQRLEYIKPFERPQVYSDPSNSTPPPVNFGAGTGSK